MAVLLTALALAAFDGWSWLRMSSAQDAAQRAAGETQVCQEMAQRIIDLERRPAVASSRQLGGSEVAQRIESAAHSAGMGTDSLLRIAPDAPRRLGDSSYLEQPTQILLRRVTLAQLAVFLHDVVADVQGLEVRGVRLSVPHEQESAGVWTVELTLADLLYSPKANSERVP
jgi:hypothetical protein